MGNKRPSQQGDEYEKWCKLQAAGIRSPKNNTEDLCVMAFPKLKYCIITFFKRLC